MKHNCDILKNGDIKDVLKRFSSLVDNLTYQLNLLFFMGSFIKNHPDINEIDIYKELNKVIDCINESKKLLGPCKTYKHKTPQVLN